MAIYHCSISEVQRSKGQNAVVAAAYISRSKLQFVSIDSFTGEEKNIGYNYSSKKGLVHSIILAPDDAPSWVYDREKLWNRAEHAETRKNAETARKFIIALPKELTLEQNIELVEQFALETLVSHGMVADINIHSDNEDNPHVHIQTTVRRLKQLENGEIIFGSKGRNWGRREFLYYYRESVAFFINQYLEKYGHLSQVSHLSHKDRGINLTPTVHEGAASHIKDSRLKVENEQILKNNILKIKENPELVFDKLSINKPVFTAEDIASSLADVLNVGLKVGDIDGSNDTDKVSNDNNDKDVIKAEESTITHPKETLQALKKQSSKEFMLLYSNILTSDKIGIVVEEDLKGRTLYALTKRLDLEERYKHQVQELNSLRSHSLNITEEKLVKSLITHTSLTNQLINLATKAIKNIASGINSATKNITSTPGTLDLNLNTDLGNINSSLSLKQRKAVLNILNGPDISILEGLPGTGKTLAMKEIVSQYKKAGYRVIGAATSSSASLNLASIAKIEAHNITRWRKRWQEANAREFELALRADYYKEEQYQNNKSFLTSRDILIIDEASMVELANLDYMLSQVRQAGAKVILIGDNNQLPAIGMAGSLKVASDIAGSSKLTEVKRQRDPDQARATYLLGHYKIDEAIELYRKEGIINVYDNKEEVQKSLVSDYISRYIDQANLLSKDDLASIRSIVICAYTNESVTKLNKQVRQQLKEAGIIKGYGDIFKIGNKNIELMRGEQIVFEANSYKNGILNGEVGTVVSFSRINTDQDKIDTNGNKISEFCKLDHGIIKVLVNKADGTKKLVNLDTRQKSIRFNYGYAMTAHKLQGASIDHTLIYYEKEVGYEAFNVMMTRHRDSVKLYANKQELEDNVYNRLDKNPEEARRKYNLVIATTARAKTASFTLRNLHSENWPLWQIGLSIGVSKRANDSLASNYIGMGESDNDKLLKSYIHSRSNVVKLLLEITRWCNLEEKVTGKKPDMWQHEAWERVIEHKNIRDNSAKFIVRNRGEFQARINQMELNYAAITKHAGSSPYSYKVNEKELGFNSKLQTNKHYNKMLILITQLQDWIQQDRSLDHANSKEFINIGKLITTLSSCYKSLQDELTENRFEFETKQKEYHELKNHHKTLKEQITEAKHYRDKLMPEYLRRIYREIPETIFTKWHELLSEYDSTIGASTAVYKNPKLLGKLKGIGFGRMYSLTNARADSIENTMVIGARFRKYENSLHFIEINSTKIKENNYEAREEELKIAAAKVQLIEPTKVEQEFIELVAQVIHVTGPSSCLKNTPENSQSTTGENTGLSAIALISLQKLLASKIIEEATISYNNYLNKRSNITIRASHKTTAKNDPKNDQIYKINEKKNYKKASYNTISDKEQKPEAKITFKEVSNYLSSSAYEDLFRKYAPKINHDGAIKKHGQRISCGSINMDLRTGLWTRFSTSQKGNIYHFISEALGIDKKAALEYIANLYAIKNTDRLTYPSINYHHTSVASSIKNEKVNDWVAMHSIPESVPKLTKDSPLMAHLAKDNEILEIYNYYNIDAELIGITIRCLDKKTGKKQVPPAAYCYNEFKNLKQWRLKGFSDSGYKPIYSIEKLKEDNGNNSTTGYNLPSNCYSKPLLIVEGEKTANIASRLLPEYRVISWLGGSGSADKARWSLLKNQEIIIWPDLDEPGIRASRKIASQINVANGHSGMVTIIDPQRLEFAGKVHLNLLPKKWDLADPLPQAMTIDNVKEAINSARIQNRSIDDSIRLVRSLEANLQSRSQISQNEDGKKEPIEEFTTTEKHKEVAEELLSKSKLIIWQTKSYGINLSLLEIKKQAAKELELRSILTSPDTINYLSYAQARGIIDYSHEFLNLAHSLYQDTLVAIWRNEQDLDCDNNHSNNNNKINELKFLAKTGRLIETGREGDDQYKKAQALKKLLTDIQNSYLTKLSNLYINEDYYKQYEKLLEPGSDRLELYKIIVRDVVLLHGQQLRGNLTDYHHKKIAQDIYQAIADHKNVNYANKKNHYRFTNHDKILMAEGAYKTVSGDDWWQIFAKEQIELSRDKLQEIGIETVEAGKIKTAKVAIGHRGGQEIQTDRTHKTQTTGKVAEEVAEYNDILHLNNHRYLGSPNQIHELQGYVQEPMLISESVPIQRHIDKQIKYAIKDLTAIQHTAQQFFKKINSRKFQEKARLYALGKINEQELRCANLSNHQIKALVIRSLFEITYEKEITDMLKTIWCNANAGKSMPVDQRISCQIDAGRITKMSSYLIEKTILDNPTWDVQLANLVKPIILEAIEAYKSRDNEIKKTLKTGFKTSSSPRIAQALLGYDENTRHAIAEQLVDHALQNGFKEITDKQFELIKKVVLLKQKLTPGIKRKLKLELMALKQIETVTETGKLSTPSTCSISKNIDACTKLAISKIDNLVYNRVSVTGMVNNFTQVPDNNKDLITQTTPLSDKDIGKFKPLIRKDYDKIIKETMDNYNKEVEELRLEQNICQENEKPQHIRQNRNMVIKL